MGLKREINGTLFELVQGDVTELDTDAIVNAANSGLQLGAGVAGAVRVKGGASIQAECDRIGGCALGDAVITGGGNLKAKYVIHAVGPRYGIDPEPETKLKSAVMKSLELADNKGLKSIGLPAVSTGIYGYPLKDAAKVILGAVIEKLKAGTVSIRHVVLCLFSEKDFIVFKKALEEMDD